ncbi:hypothetical protein HYW30_00965 [Candidatus Azambacteria bacterium]|nr:hypothetical protein [Candidatus Azambacteria bacterium]
MAKPADGRTQEFLQIADIRDGVVILKNGGLRRILMASSLNFELKSQDEQEALTYAYQNVLNSLDFSIQVVIHSRRLNIAPYLETIKARLVEIFLCGDSVRAGRVGKRRVPFALGGCVWPGGRAAGRSSRGALSGIPKAA